MNLSPLAHGALAAAIQIAVTFATGGNWLAGAAAGAWFYIGREHAQYEVRKQRHEPAWTRDAVADLVVPCVVVSVLAFAAINFGWQF